MARINSYDAGDRIRLTAEFTDPDNDDAPVDPSTVQFIAWDAQGRTHFDYTHGTDNEVTNPSVGTYRVEFVAPDKPGTWTYRVVSTGNGAAAGKRQFKVRAAK